MKKLLVLLSIIGLTFSAYADEKEDESGTKNQEKRSSTENEESAPPPPPTKVTNELEENDSPVDLLERIEELEDEVKKLQEDKSDLLDDLDSATHEIKSLLEDRKELRSIMNQMEVALNRGPGSLFRGWVYSLELKWIYVSPTITPYAYSQNDGWMLYEYGTNPRRVYYYKTKEWRLLDNVDENESKNER